MIKVQARNESCCRCCRCHCFFSSIPLDPVQSVTSKCPGFLRLTPNRPRLRNVNIVIDIASVILHAIAYEIYYTVYS